LHTGAEPGGLRRGICLNPLKIFLPLVDLFLDTLDAHPQPLIKGIDITRGDQRLTILKPSDFHFHCFKLVQRFRN
jgi:hypothetical protein